MKLDHVPQNSSISLIVPIFNEEESIDGFFTEIIPILKKTHKSFEIICVNDGSSDNSLIKLLQCKQTFPCIRIIDLSRNFGKEAALTAGLDAATGNAVIPIDVDLQDPPELILDLVKHWEEGYEVVLAQRTDRRADSWLKRLTSFLFYKFQQKISHVPITENVGDFRLLDKKVVTALRQLPERQRYMKGLFAWTGFKQIIIPYTRQARKAGTTKWNYWKLWNFALDGFTSFSTLPIRIWTYLGLFISLCAFMYGIFIIIKTWIYGVDMPGYASIMVTLLFLSGMQFISLGILGEYIGRIYTETKQRPIYIVREQID